MRNLKAPSELSQNDLFDTEEYGWWRTQLAPEAFRRLANGMEGTIRASILKLLPAAQMGQSFSEDFGRPTKELYAVCGLLLLAEFRNWTVDQSADAWCFDAAVQFALNLPRDRQNMCPRTVDNYRRLLRENEMAQEIFEQVTAAIVKEMGLVIAKQRLDSTHILSDMARFGRLKLLGVTVKRFLVQLKRHHMAEYEGLSEALRQRYEAAESRLFGSGTKHPRPYQEAIQEVAEDMAELIARFGERDAIAARSSFKALARAFSEHCEVMCEETAVVRPKAVDDNGQSAQVMQNPSDLDAGFDGHKGPGYQVQLAQAYDTGEGAPGIVTACIPQSAAESDSAAVAAVQQQQERMGTLPEQQLADTAYGSQANVEMCAEKNVKLIAPVSGGSGGQTAPCNEVMSACGEINDPRSPSGLKKTALEERRATQHTEEWKRQYGKRSGIEGLHEALDRTTGIKQLRVRGKRAVAMAVYLKVTGWNILTASKIAARRRKRTEMALETAGNCANRPLTRRRGCPFPVPSRSAEHFSPFSRLLPRRPPFFTRD